MLFRSREVSRRKRKQVAPMRRRQLQLALISFASFMMVWFKDGGATYDLSLFVFLAVFTVLVNSNIDEKRPMPITKHD